MGSINAVEADDRRRLSKPPTQFYVPAAQYYASSYQPPFQMGVYYWPLRGIVLVPPEAGFATHFVLAAAISGSLLHPQVYRSLPVL